MATTYSVKFDGKRFDVYKGEITLIEDMSNGKINYSKLLPTEDLSEIIIMQTHESHINDYPLGISGHYALPDADFIDKHLPLYKDVIMNNIKDIVSTHHQIPLINILF